MLKKLEIKEFEAHKDTTIYFGPGLNVIHGNSNNGKSASLRAIELAAYGEWAAGENKKEGVDGPVRVGAKSCEIKVESDKGSVLVRRGKNINEWEISNTEIDEKFTLQNPGAGAIPQAQDVLGLRSIEIAGTQIRFNWSDQRDKHFLIDEVEGKPSSPSFVAGVLDEVGGLSGCEDLVRELASDKSSHEKAMRDAADQTSKINDQLQKFNELDSEISRMSYTEKAINEAEKLQNEANVVKNISEGIKNLKDRIKKYENLDSEIKTTENNSKILEKISDQLEKLKKILQILFSYQQLNVKKSKIKEELEKLELIDVSIVIDKQTKSENFRKAAEEQRKLLFKIRKLQKQLDEKEDFLDFRKAAKIIVKIESEINNLESTKKIITSINNKKSQISVAENNFEKTELKFQKSNTVMKDVKLQYEKLLDEKGICPTCGQELTAKCKAEMIEGV